MRFLLTFLRAYPGESTVMLIALLAAGVVEGVSVTALLPLLNLMMGDGATPAEAAGVERFFTQWLNRAGIEPSIGLLLVIIVIGLVFKNLLLLFANKRIGYIAARLTTGLRLELLRTMMASTWSYFVHQPVGRLSNAMATEAIRAADGYVFGMTMLALGVQTLVYAGIAFMVSWKATVACLAASAVVTMGFYWLLRMAKKAGRRQTKLLISLLSRLTDTLQSVKPLKAMGRENLADRVLQSETGKLNRALQREVFSKAVLSSSQEPIFAIVIATGIFLALQIFSMPLPTVMVLVLVLTRVLHSLGKVQKHYQKMIVCESAYWSLRETIKAAERAAEVSSGRREAKLDAALELEDVHFSHGDSPVLRGVSLRIPAGSLVTLVGASGVGKTTLIDLVTGLQVASQGRVSADGVALDDIDLRSWRRLIGYVPQENLLLHDSVLHNVTLGDPELSEADAVRALKAAGAWDFVQQLPQGIRATVGERGARLSGGQRQRVLIARALAHRPRLLILDEATSALDPASEAAVCETLRELKGELTILAVSHESSLAAVADCVYRLQDGHARVQPPTPRLAQAPA